MDDDCETRGFAGPDCSADGWPERAKAMAQGGSKDAQIDSQIQADVMKALDNKRFKDVKASVQNGVVTSDRYGGSVQREAGCG